MNAWRLYTEKRDYFQDLSEVHRSKIPEWYGKDRKPTVGENGEVKSVYRHSTSKGKPVIVFSKYTYTRTGLSFEAVYQRLLTKTARPTSTTAHSAVQEVYFLAEGISIQVGQ
jgi:hypothetical protein